MAIIKIGAPLSGIRGTLGGITYSENKSSVYAKLWSRPSNPRTPKQMLERAYMSTMPALWAALTDVQRAAWRTFAADPAQELTNSLGEAYYASGYNWFCKCNIRLTRVGRAPIVPVPAQARPAAPAITEFRVCETGTESDLCTCGVASASTEHPTALAAKAFNNNLSAGDRWSTSVGNPTGWLRYDLCVAANVKRYRIYTGTINLARLPLNWEFQVWEGGGWTTIHTVTGMVFATLSWYEWACVNPYTETDYRLLVTANNGDADWLQINEMEYYAGDVGASVVIYPEDEFEDGPDYDLVLHVAQGLSPALIDQYPGYYQILAVQTPNRWQEYFQTELEEVFGNIQMTRSWFAELYRQTREGLRSAPQTDRTITIGA